MSHYDDDYGASDKRKEEEAAKAQAAAAQAAKAAKAEKDRIAAAQGELDNADQTKVSNRSAKEFGLNSTNLQKDIVSGSKFGEAVLGEEGLGRSTDSQDVVSAMDQLREQSKGFSGKESLARREQAIGNQNQNQQATERALQAKLARAGVRGGQAGAQVRDTAIAGMQQRGNLERDLFLDGEAAKRQGTQVFAEAAAEQGRFDLGQAAKEKNIVLQSGLGFAQLGAAERGAKIQADASVRSAAASAPRCHTGDAEVLMEDGTYKRIDNILIGDRVSLGGRVKGIGVAEAEYKMYNMNGETVTGTHLLYVETAGKYIAVENLEFEELDLPESTLVYPMATENGCYVTKLGGINGDLLTEENTKGLSFSIKRKSTLG